ncbi:hypothetical protein DSECCO2_481820 [anaerobic digester metagenome]
MFGDFLGDFHVKSLVQLHDDEGGRYRTGNDVAVGSKLLSAAVVVQDDGGQSFNFLGKVTKPLRRGTIDDDNDGIAVIEFLVDVSEKIST